MNAVRRHLRRRAQEIGPAELVLLGDLGDRGAGDSLPACAQLLAALYELPPGAGARRLLLPRLQQPAMTMPGARPCRIAAAIDHASTLGFEVHHVDAESPAEPFNATYFAEAREQALLRSITSAPHGAGVCVVATGWRHLGALHAALGSRMAVAATALVATVPDGDEQGAARMLRVLGDAGILKLRVGQTLEGEDGNVARIGGLLARP